MGIIMRNNIAYSGGSSNETVELTLAEYERREAAGAIDSDTIYFINDATDSYNAGKIMYDNTESGIEASTVQGAIDELNSNIIKKLEGYSNPIVIALVSDNSAYTNESGNYILADSLTGLRLLEDSETYTTITVEGNFYRMAGADSVCPFKKEIKLEEVTETGTTSHSTTWASASAVTVTFKTPFKYKPSVTATFGSSGKFVACYITNIKETSCSVVAVVDPDELNSKTKSCSVKWTAIGLI